MSIQKRTLQIPGTACAVFKGWAIKSLWLEHTLTEEEQQGTKLERRPKRSASPHGRGWGGGGGGATVNFSAGGWKRGEEID